MKRLALVLLAVGLLAGCSSSKQVTTIPATTSPAASAASSAAKTATTAQVASVVAGQKPAVDKAASSVTCKASYAANDPLCGITRLAYNVSVQTLSSNLGGAVNPSSVNYIGQAPAEITPLITATLAAAAAMGDAQSKLVSACSGGSSSACSAADGSWQSAQGRVTQALASWSPYTH